MKRLSGLGAWVVVVVLASLGPIAAPAYAAPVVAQVTASQRTDGSKRVDIRYNLTAANACTVTVLVSNDGGATWTITPTAVSGAVGSGVTPATGKLIVWDCTVDLPGAFGNQYKVRVCADDSQAPSGMVLIPAGEFQMGDTFNEGASDNQELPVHAVWVDAFYMDKYEVTNAQYAAALNWANGQGQLYISGGSVYKAGSGTSYPYCYTTSGSSYSRITWDGSTFGVTAGKEHHPMVVVSWYGSVAYANWRSAMQGKPLCYDLSTWACNFNANGYRLPTEAEWEKAARGGTSGHRFPWSDSDLIQHARANYYSSTSYSYDTSLTRGYHPTFNTGSYPYTSPVGYFTPNGYGLYDMAGNVWEWCNDWYSSTYYSTTPYPHVNPHGPTSGTYRVLRGGGWDLIADVCRVAVRYGGGPNTRYDGIGFRCAVGT